MATEVNKLSHGRAAHPAGLGGRGRGRRNVPLAVTVAETSVPGQIEFVKAAAAVGAELGDPAAATGQECAGVRADPLLRRDRRRLADSRSASRTRPEYLGIGLSHAGIMALHRAHPNVAIVKLEATALSIARLIERGRRHPGRVQRSRRHRDDRFDPGRRRRHHSGRRSIRCDRPHLRSDGGERRPSRWPKPTALSEHPAAARRPDGIDGHLPGLRQAGASVIVSESTRSTPGSPRRRPATSAWPRAPIALCRRAGVSIGGGRRARATGAI